jgi:hypothetical protein
MPARRFTIVMTLVLAVVVLAATGQDAGLLKRWVGTHEGRPLVLDFYGDSMVVVNDVHVADYSVRGRRLSVSGDTSFTATYWFALDRLLLETDAGVVLTLAQQDLLARPMFGQWVGALSPSGTGVELYLGRGGVARWRTAGSGWTDGEWNRRSRTIVFTWMPDSTEWSAQYDPLGAALLFEETEGENGLGFAVLRHRYR